MSKDYSDIKNYSFKKDIGEGNFGKVKLGIFKPTGEEFAVKVLNKDKIKIKMKNSIFKENQIITKFNHINVIYVFQILEDEENFYIIMEYCKHGELFDYIVKNEKLSEEESSIFFFQLINGIEHIHSKGIAHRDLKPENLLLAENNILKIIDFGLSHEYWGEEDELLKTKCGSPSYAAPEIICCPFYDGFKVDIWCCGIILYAMICGYLPFEGDSNDILFKNILNCDPEFPEFLSETSKDIIIKILNPDPDGRITINEIKKHKFYLMGKRLCKIDYDTIENSVIKKRNIIFKNMSAIKKNTNAIINESNDNINQPKDSNAINSSNKDNNNNKENNNDNNKDKNNENNNNDKNFDKNNDNNISNKKVNIVKSNNNKSSNKKDLSIKNNINNKFKNDECLKSFKEKFIDTKMKYTKTIDTISNKMHQILKTDYNHDINRNIKRPNSSKKHKIDNNKINVKTSNNINSDNKKKVMHTDLSSDNKNLKKCKKDSILIKILDSTKNYYLNFQKEYEKLGLNKHKTSIFSDKNEEHNKRRNHNSKNKNKNKDKDIENISIDKKNNMNKKNNNNNIIKTIDNQIISLSNEHLTSNSNNNKKHQKYNLFKEALKNKSKIRNKYNFKKTLSRYEQSDNNKNNSNYNKILKTPSIIKKYHINNSNSSRKMIQNKDLNIYIPNSTLYYNNINININELNINSKISKNKKSHVISSLNNNQKLKSFKSNDFTSLENKNNKNKAISAKRMLSYNINNLKNKNNKYCINNNTINNNSKANVYIITNNSNQDCIINSINSNDSNNLNINRKVLKIKNNNNNNLKYNKNSKSSSKIGRILSTEPKEMFKFRKQFSFDKKNDKKTKNGVESKVVKNSKRSKSEKANKSRTINTEVGKKILCNKYLKKEANKKKENKYKFDINNLDEIFLYKFIEHKYNKKKNQKEIGQKNYKNK